jgi:hypothetical protein
MTCEEFERVLPELEGGHNLEQEQHLNTCSACADLIADLVAIEQNARLLQDQEPSPRVWDNIESALRREGLIREPQLQVVRPPAHAPRWRFAWLVPIAAGLLFGTGLLIMRWQVSSKIASRTPVITGVQRTGSVPQPAAMATAEDPAIKLLAARAPCMRASYESDLRAVESYIHDAELAARNNPNDEISQQHLMNAYEQKAMLYEIAMHRALP